MRMTLFVALLVLCGTTTAWTQDYATRMRDAYIQTDHNYDLDCYYNYNKTWQLVSPIAETVRGTNELRRSFELDNGKRKIDFDFRVYDDDGVVKFEGVFDGRLSSAGKVKNREFNLPVSDETVKNDFETSKLLCAVNFAYAYPLVLQDGEYHISVHPHNIYDWQNRLKAPIETYLNDMSRPSIILLDTGNARGNSVSILDFFAGKEPNLPMTNLPSTLEDVPLSVPLIVAPAGNSRYEIRAENEITVTYTGGNHNYCIWNSARHILENLLNSRSSAKINFRYDMSAIVAQVKGVEHTGINFPRASVKKSNLLKDLLADANIQATYHKNYMYYFADWLADEYQGMYRTYTIDYEAVGFKKTVTFKGNGTRDLRVTFRYF